MLNVISEGVRQAADRDVTIATVRGGSLIRAATQVRQRILLAIAILRPTLSLAQLAVPFGMDHSSVKHAIKRERQRVDCDTREAARLNELVTRFQPDVVAAPNLMQRLEDAARALDAAGSSVRAARDALDLAEAGHG